MSDAFMTALFACKEVKAVARVKLPTGETRSVTLHQVPVDASDAAFAEAASKGVDLAVRVRGEDDRSRTINGRGVYGAPATAATCAVLGFVPPEQERAKVRKSKDTTTDAKPKDTPSEPTIG